MPYSEALAHARSGKIQSAQEALSHSLEDEQASVNDWPETIELIARLHKDDTVEALAWATLDAIQQRLPARQAVPHCGRILRLFSKHDEFRTRAVELYEQAYPEVESLETLIDLAGLRGGKPIRRALQTLDLCLAIQPDDYLVHKDDGPAARVVAVDCSSWNIRIETPDGQELFDAVSLGDHYERAEPHDFRVLRQFDPDGFCQKLNADPAEIVLTIVMARDNEITSDDLEAMLTPQYIERSEWAKWWNKARTALRRNGNLRLEGRNPVVIIYDHRALPLETELGRKFDVHAGPKAWLDLALQYVRECKNRNQPIKAAFLTDLRESVRTEAIQMESRGDSQALMAWLTVTELARLAELDADDADAVRLLTGGDSVHPAFRSLQAEVYWPLALQALKRARPESWCENYADLLPIAVPSRCDGMVREIKNVGRLELLTNVVPTIMADPLTCVNGLCWLYSGPADAALLDLPPLVTLLTRLFAVLDQLRTSTTVPIEHAKEVRNRIRNTLSARKCQRFQDCIEEIDIEMASAMRTQITRASGLSDALRTDLMNQLRRRFGTLWARPRKEIWEDDRTLCCTREGYQAKEAELNELVNVKMKENAIAIGRAAEHGDLSENAEYKFALEERDLLRARSAEIQNQMAMARVLGREDVPSEYVSVGATVELRQRGGNDSLTLTFLGPWEANVDRNVLNYLAPISQQFMGAKVGTAIPMEYKGLKGEFEIVSIRPGIA